MRSLTPSEIGARNGADADVPDEGDVEEGGVGEFELDAIAPPVLEPEPEPVVEADVDCEPVASGSGTSSY